MNMKKLLASALAATMLFTTAVTSFVASAAVTVGTITAGNVDKVVGDTDTISTEITIDFPDGVVAPHDITTVSLEGYNLTDATLGEVTYAESSKQGKVWIDPTSEELAKGEILIQSPVDDIAPTVKKIILNVTFTDADDIDTAAGTYSIVVDGNEMTNFDEEDLDVTATNGTFTVKVAHVCEAGTPVSNENGTHDIPCVGCDKLVADDEQCTYGDDGACTVCGYKEPVVEPELGELTATSASFVYKNSMELPIQYQGVSYSGDASAVEEFGIIAIREDKYDGVTPLTPQTPNAMSMTWDTVQSSPNLYIYGFAFKFITKEYIVVSYVKVGENYIYGEKYQESYADLCVNRIARGDTSSNGYKYAKHYLDTYYTLFDVKLYDGAENLPAADTSKKYVGNYTKTQHDFPVATGELTTSVSREDGTLLFNNMEFGYGVYFNYSGEAEVLKSGVLILREDKYTQGTAITKETPGVMFDEADGLMDKTYTIYGFSLANIAKDYIFVPYVETTEGTVYGEYRALAFADVILARLNASGHAKSKAIFDAYYMMASSSNITPSQLITAVDK